MIAPVQGSLWGGQRLQMDESIRLTIESLLTYGPRHKHWAIAWSGGKDSTALLTLVVYLITSGKVSAPETLTVCYADTRMELLPLWVSAASIRDELAEKGIECRTVMAPMDRRFLVYILGRGVPPPNNNTLRWCTRQIKIEPMADELERIFGQRSATCVACSGRGSFEVPAEEIPEHVRAVAAEMERHIGEEYEVAAPKRVCKACDGKGRTHEKLLMLTGVRQGESAIRDGRIAMSCGRNGGECGQGWYQETLPGALCDTLAPMLHWRVCHVWEWLRHWAPKPEFGDWSTELLADAYGGDEAEEINARTGCIGCPLAQNDTALDNLVARPTWSYLSPLKEIRPVYRWLREPAQRLRKEGGETRGDGTLVKNQQRMGPITLEARSEALARMLDIQARINAEATRLGRPPVDFLNAEEVARIRELISAKTWPNKWTGEEPLATKALPAMFADGSVQPLLFGDGE